MAARRPVLMLLLSMAAGWSFAQTPARTEPLPAPPPPPDIAGDPDLEPQVTIIRTRRAGRTRKCASRASCATFASRRATARPYYLIPDGNGATFIRRDSLDSSLKVPMWVLFSL